MSTLTESITGTFTVDPTHSRVGFVARHAMVTSTKIEALGDATFRVTGDLTIKDVTKPAEFDVELTGTAVDPWGNTRLGLEATAVVNRKDWGLSWNTALEAGGVLVGDKITLEVEISAIANSTD